MKLLLPFLFFFSYFGFSQEIKYELFIINSCSGKIKKSSFYRLEKNGVEYSSFENGFITLSEKGKYKLTAIEFEEERIVSIKNTLNSDTIKTPKIVEFLSTHKNPVYLYKNCDELCNGIQIDYYPDGSIRIKGEFEKGLIIGELRKYYQNGNLKEFSIYNKRGVVSIKTLFYKTGKIKEFTTYNKRGILSKKTLFE